jgi:hypothetical protein
MVDAVFRALLFLIRRLLDASHTVEDYLALIEASTFRDGERVLPT